MSRWIVLLPIVLVGFLLGVIFSPADPLSAIVFSGLLVGFGLWAHWLGIRAERARQRAAESGSSQSPATQFRLLTLLAVVLAVAIVCWLIRGDRPSSAILEIELDQPAAIVLIDDQAVSQVVNSSGSVRTIEVAPGEHKLTVELNGYQGVSQNFDVQAGHRVSIRAPLTPNSRP